MICSPSYRMRLGTEKEEVSLPPLLAQGWAVVVPDYEGLLSAYTVGTPGRPRLPSTASARRRASP